MRPRGCPRRGLRARTWRAAGASRWGWTTTTLLLRRRRALRGARALRLHALRRSIRPRRRGCLVRLRLRAARWSIRARRGRGGVRAGSLLLPLRRGRTREVARGRVRWLSRPTGRRRCVLARRWEALWLGMWRCLWGRHHARRRCNSRWRARGASVHALSGERRGSAAAVHAAGARWRRERGGTLRGIWRALGRVRGRRCGIGER